MPRKLRLTPDDDFPEDLKVLPDAELQILDSQIQRQLDMECVINGQPDPETEFRRWDLDDEFLQREAAMAEEDTPGSAA
ncbi:hypothetical protein [Arthrobacter sp. ISL-30]|jgi:hypothetical protein|uniref:hypothetical protein n=1 Tax=Arthrobacter sp. ISL-30 TaxID=2819109 RepID=UPI001BE517D0|nr:hypothetical protein [Arthrobacter sp. ISL-30]MBT2513532.1 hypothetical protein [Arthrobacter sp. ISL-30]